MKKIYLMLFVVIFAFVVVLCNNSFAKQIQNDEIKIEDLVDKLEKHSLLICKNNNIEFQDERGIKPLLIQIDKNGLKNALVVDKVIGKAAALLMVYGKVKQVHTNIIAKDAIKVFDKYKVKYSYNEIVEFIQNQNKNGLCPMEQKVINIENPKKAYKIFLGINKK